jgi:hypothetical protein
MPERETLAFSIDVGWSGPIASRLTPTLDVYLVSWSPEFFGAF